MRFCDVVTFFHTLTIVAFFQSNLDKLSKGNTLLIIGVYPHLTSFFLQDLGSILTFLQICRPLDNEDFYKRLLLRPLKNGEPSGVELLRVCYNLSFPV